LRAWFKQVSIVKYLFAFIVLSFASANSLSETLKVAIIDSFHYQKFVTTQYKKFYLMGIDLAVQEAKKLGFDVKYKLFLYQDTDLSIFSSIRAMNKWRPTLIIGPRTSNKFLLLHPGVKDIMALSPFATSDKLALLPKNFFGITLPSKYAARSQFLLIRNISWCPFIGARMGKRAIPLKTKYDLLSQRPLQVSFDSMCRPHFLYARF
jgi:hypothetical protein